MKKSILLLLAITLSFTSFAQSKLTEGKVVSVQTMSSNDADTSAQLAMIGDVVTTTYFKDTKSRAEVSSPMTGDVVAIADMESKDVLMLMDDPMRGKNYMMVNADQAQQQIESVEVTERNDTKTVLGHVCKGYDVKVSAGGQDLNVLVYATENISAYSQQSQMFDNKIKGFPMYIKMDMDQMGKNITIENKVTEIKEESVSNDKFNMTPPEGYSEMKK